MDSYSTVCVYCTFEIRITVSTKSHINHGIKEATKKKPNTKLFYSCLGFLTDSNHEKVEVENLLTRAL